MLGMSPDRKVGLMTANAYSSEKYFMMARDMGGYI